MAERLDVLLGRPTEANFFARRPANFAESLKDPVDAFSEILCGVKLNGAVFFSAEFSAPWGFSTPPATVIADEFASAAEHLVLYHFVIDGGAVVQLIDGPSVELTAGCGWSPCWASLRSARRCSDSVSPTGR